MASLKSSILKQAKAGLIMGASGPRINRRPDASSRGFTLVEMLITAALMAIVFSLALFFSADSYRAYSFHNERDLAVSLLQKARAQAMANINQAPHGLHVDNTDNRYAIFEGTSFNPLAAANIYIPFAAPNIDHAGMADVIFNQLNAGIASVPAGWHFTDGIRTSDINFNPEGRIAWTN